VKIVLDTTILVRATERSHGLARELLTNIVEGEHRVLLSNEMLHEPARVLRYPRLQGFYGLTEGLVLDYVNFLRRSSEIVTLDPLACDCAHPRCERYHRDADRAHRHCPDASLALLMCEETDERRELASDTYNGRCLLPPAFSLKSIRTGSWRS
jgi:predicted nucleic acid-binding protein